MFRFDPKDIKLTVEIKLEIMLEAIQWWFEQDDKTREKAASVGAVIQFMAADHFGVDKLFTPMDKLEQMTRDALASLKSLDKWDDILKDEGIKRGDKNGVQGSESDETEGV